MKSFLRPIRFLLPLTVALAICPVSLAHAKPSKMDTDGDGFVSLEEFAAAKKRFSPEKAEKRFRRADTDGDGKLSPAEVKAMRGAKKSKAES